MTREEADAFASSWIDAWNRRDVEAVLTHFADDVQFASPNAATVVGRATISGKEQLRAYWLAALQRIASLAFTLDYPLWDSDRQELAIVYERDVDGVRGRVCEILRFDESGHVVRGEVLHGAQL